MSVVIYRLGADPHYCFGTLTATEVLDKKRDSIDNCSWVPHEDPADSYNTWALLYTDIIIMPMRKTTTIENTV